MKSRKAIGLKLKPMPNLEKLYPRDPEPSRAQALLLLGQMSQYNEEIETCALQGLSKLWLTQAVHSDQQLS